MVRSSIKKTCGACNKPLNDPFPGGAENVRAVQGHTAGRERGGTLVEQINESGACEYHVDRCVRDADVGQTRASNRCGYFFLSRHVWEV